MGTRNFLVLKTSFDLLHKRLLNRVEYGNMVGVVGSMWVFVCGFVFYVVGFISRFIFRYQADDQKNKSPAVCLRLDDQTDVSAFGEKETGFHVQNEENNHENEEESKGSDIFETAASVSSANKYEFFYGNDINGYIEEPKAVSFTVQELYSVSDEYTITNNQILENPVSSDEDFPGKYSETEGADLEEAEDNVIDSFGKGEVLEKQEEQETFSVHELSEVGEENTSVEEIFQKQEMGNFPEKTELSSEMTDYPETSFDISKEVESFSENYSLPSDAETLSNILRDGSSRKDDAIDSISYERDREGLKPKIPPAAIDDDEEENIAEFLTQDGEGIVFSAEHNDSDEEYIELEPHKQSTTPSALESKSFLVEDSVFVKDGPEVEEDDEEEEEKDSQNNLDFVYEHEDVIEQLKWEIRNARTGGLPTILEEESDSETPKKEEILNLKLLKIDLKFGYKDRIEEIHKVYKIYAEKMRKLDILNSQTMHAIGFLHLKGQVKSNPVQKPLVPIVKSLLPRIAQRSRAVAADPMLKYAGKLHKDFELVYVGQVCLSWEILHWQQRKIQELLQQYDDVPGSYRYNLVASDFQLFQVLLQRFVEDESFQGPRVQNYVKNRCVIRSLLQVPAVKDDCAKDKQYGMEGNEDAIRIENLAKIIVESMFTFWEFIRKDEKNTINQKLAQHIEIDPADSKLLTEIRKDFVKKERKVNDIQRSGNCVVKKFQKHQDCGLQHTLFLAQVELRLISRVLNMSRLTRDQLIWCKQKLNQISFVNKRVNMETSFFLFPC